MCKSFGFGVVTLLAITSSAALSQDQTFDKRGSMDAIALPATIDYMPPMAKAVLTGDPDRVSEVLGKADVNEPVHAKKGQRAGFTPLMLAAAFSDPKIVDMLIRGGAKVTILDDYHRSAFWYAAFREDVAVTEILIKTPSVDAGSVKDIVNKADGDLERTPLHLAVRGNQPSLTKLLIEAGASGTQKDVLGETPRDFCSYNSTGGCEGLVSK